MWVAKRLINRVEQLEDKVAELDKHTAVHKTIISDIRSDIRSIDRKLDKIFDALQKRDRRHE